MQENCGAKGGQQYDADKSVRRKERGIQPAEIVGANKSMLVNEQGAGCNHANERDWSKSSYEKQPN